MSRIANANSVMISEIKDEIMIHAKRFLSIFTILMLSSHTLYAANGKKVFETYCWGCHHQSAVAFGPSFEQIASQRNADEIRGMIADPKSVSVILGYKRNAMPAFSLKEEELKAITTYILSYKPKEEK